jgi:aromatic ring-opening dioxygenase LigB subunit
VSEANAARGVTESLGHRVAAHLLDGVPFEPQLALPYAAAALLELDQPTTVIVMADGSARRGEKAPGHLHPDAVAFDERIELALRSGDAEALAALDPEIGEELWCEGVPGLRVLGELARDRGVVAYVSYADAPYGVAWWVARWDLS